MSGPGCLEDDLEYNPFYLALQEHFPVALQDAQKKCHIICVPHSRVLDGQVIDRTFVDTHILKPSPYFQGYYVTTDRACSKSLQLETSQLNTAEGFPDERRINILADETGYNKDFKPYKILILDSTIWPPPKVLLPSTSEGPLTALPFKTTIEENVAYLKSLAEHKEALTNLDKSVKLFNDNYMVLQKYLLDAGGRLLEMWTRAVSDFTNSHQGMNSDGRFYQHVTVAIESYIMDGVHQKVFPVIMAASARQDKALSKKKYTINKNPEDLGLSSQFCCDQPTAVQVIEKLDTMTTPIEKLLCMKNALDAMSNTVNAHILDSHSIKDKDAPCLASDDLIPLLVKVISESRAEHLLAHLYHIENFHWSTSSTDDLSYALVTFKAATQYISNTDFDKPGLTPPTLTTQLQTDPVTGANQSTVQSSIEPQISAPKETNNAKMSRFDRQMDRITKMLDMSTKELAGSSTNFSAPPPKPIFSYGSSRPRQSSGCLSSSSKTPKDLPLGEFLSGLKADTWHSSYGKQT